MRESWGQPPICFYTLSSDGENMYATALDDPYGELGCSNEPHMCTLVLPEEAVEAVATDMECAELPDYESMRASGELAFWDSPEEDIY